MLQPDFSTFPILRTNRCFLRRINREDAPQVFLLRTHEAIMQYLDREQMKALEEAMEMIRNMETTLMMGEGISWALCLDGDSRMIGQIGLWKIMREHYRAEVGYTLLPEFWNSGLMTEALKEVVRFGFQELGLHSIEANVNPHNAASIRLLEKQGFVREGYFRENYYYKGRFLDSAIYSLVKEV